MWLRWINHKSAIARLRCHICIILHLSWWNSWDPCERAQHLDDSIGLEVEGLKLKVDMKKYGAQSLSPPFQERLGPYTKRNLVCTQLGLMLSWPVHHHLNVVPHEMVGWWPHHHNHNLHCVVGCVNYNSISWMKQSQNFTSYLGSYKLFCTLHNVYIGALIIIFYIRYSFTLIPLEYGWRQTCSLVSIKRGFEQVDFARLW